MTLDDDVKTLVEASGNGAIRARSPEAADVAAAKRRGAIGEQADGFLGAVETPNSTMAALVARENNVRQAKYGRIAQARGFSTDDVAKAAAVRRLEAATPGERVRDETGTWHPVESAVRVTVLGRR